MSENVFRALQKRLDTYSTRFSGYDLRGRADHIIKIVQRRRCRHVFEY